MNIFTVSRKVLRSIPEEIVEIIIKYAYDFDIIKIYYHYESLKFYRAKLDRILLDPYSCYNGNESAWTLVKQKVYVIKNSKSDSKNLKKLKKSIKDLEFECSDIYSAIKAFIEGAYISSESDEDENFFSMCDMLYSYEPDKYPCYYLEDL